MFPLQKIICLEYFDQMSSALVFPSHFCKHVLQTLYLRGVLAGPALEVAPNFLALSTLFSSSCFLLLLLEFFFFSLWHFPILSILLPSDYTHALSHLPYFLSWPRSPTVELCFLTSIKNWIVLIDWLKMHSWPCKWAYFIPVPSWPLSFSPPPLILACFLSCCTPLLLFFSFPTSQLSSSEENKLFP